MTDSLFSIIIPLYNKRNTIERTVSSIAKQSITDFELVVVDDGSTDDSKLFVESILPANGICVSKQNGGVSSARNYGADYSSGEWLLFLDADDELTSDSLEIFLNAIKENPLCNIFVAGEIYNRKEKNKRWSRRLICPLFMFWRNAIHPRPGALLINKSIYLDKKGFDERMSFYEDTEFAIRILSNNKVIAISDPTVVYHQDAGGLSDSSHPLEKEMAYYIPEQIATASFWHKALLYENLEMEILWWQQHDNEANVKFYKDMQKLYFSWIFKALHWIRQKMIRRGII